MLFKDVSLHLHGSEYEGLYGSDFDFRSRYICHYLGRVVRPLRVHTDGFWSIAVRGRSSDERDCSIRGADVLGVDVPFDSARYDALSDDEAPEFFLSMLKEGLDVAHRSFEFPYRELLEGMDLFREGGYRNEWTHKKRLFRGMGGLRGWLNCKMDSKRFALRLRLERKGELLYDEEILDEKPDEMCFAFQFKDMVIEGNTLVVVKRRGGPLMKLDLEPLLNS